MSSSANLNIAHVWVLRVEGGYLGCSSYQCSIQDTVMAVMTTFPANHFAEEAGDVLWTRQRFHSGRKCTVEDEGGVTVPNSKANKI